MAEPIVFESINTSQVTPKGNGKSDSDEPFPNSLPAVDARSFIAEKFPPF